MADNVTGIVLDIPADVLQNIKNADKEIKNLEQTSLKAARNIKFDFGTTMVNGVDAFIRKVREAQGKLDSLKMPTIDTTGLSGAVQELSRAMSTVDRSATTGANRIGRIANAMTKLQTANPNPMLFQNIADGIAKIGNTSQQTIDNVRNLSQIMAQLARDIRTVQAAQSAQTSNTATAAQYNKLYKEQAQIMREIIALQNKPQKSSDELDLLTKLKNRYQDIYQEIDKLNRKQQTNASELAKAQGKLRNEMAKRIADPAGAINYAKNAKSLNELQAAYKNLKAVMATVKPDTKEWTQMNTQLEKTRNRIDEIRRKMGEFKSTASGVGDIAGQLARTLAATFSVSAITGYINKMIQVRAQFELQQTALRAILQNKDEADRIFMQVQQLALQSPFSIMQMTSYTKQLAAYRIESEKLVGTTKMLADVSAGLGVDMGRLILAYGQVKAANYLRATEVRQFTEAGLNIAGELANYFSELQGKMISVGDVMDMITKRMVRFEDVEEVFKRVTSAGGLFYDMQKKQSETLWGQLQRIKDAMSIMFNEIGKSNQTTISSMLTFIRELLQEWRKLMPIVNAFGAALATKVITVGLIGAIRQLKLVAITLKRITSLQALWNSLSKANVWGAVLGVLASIVAYIITAKNETSALADELNRIRTEAATDLKESIADFHQLAKAATDATKSYTERKEALDSLNRAYKDILPAYMLESEWLEKQVGNYDAAIAKIQEYFQAKEMQKQVETILSSDYYNDAVKQMQKLGEDMLINGVFDATVTKKYTDAWMSQIASEIASGKIENSAEAVGKRLSEIFGKEVLISDSQWKDIYKNFEKLSEEVNHITLGTASAKDQTELWGKELEKLSTGQLQARINEAREDLERYSKAIMQAQSDSRKGITAASARYLGVDTMNKSWLTLEQLNERYDQLTVAVAQYEQAMAGAYASEVSEGIEKQISELQDELTAVHNLAVSYDQLYSKNTGTEEEAARLETLNSELEKAKESTISVAKEMGVTLTDAELANIDNMFDLQRLLDDVAQRAYPELAKKSVEEVQKGEVAIKALVDKVDWLKRAINSFSSGLGFGTVFEDVMTEADTKTEKDAQGIQKLWNLERQRNEDYIKSAAERAGIDDKLIAQEKNLVKSKGQSDMDYAKNLRAQAKAWKEQKAAVDDMTEAQRNFYFEKNQLSQQTVDLQAKEADALEDIANAYDPQALKKTKGRTGSGKDPWIEIFTQRIKAVQDFYKQYDTLRERFSAEESQRRDVASFMDYFNATGLDVAKVISKGWDTQALVSNLEEIEREIKAHFGTIYDDAKEIMKRGVSIEAVVNPTAEQKMSHALAKMLNDLQKQIADNKIKLDFEIQEQKEQDIKRQIDEMFDNYNLTKELGKLGLNVDLTYMVGGKPMPLDKIRSELARLRAESGGDESSKNLIKIYEDAEKKITDMENKAAVERLKNYYKYSLEATSARVQLELKAQQEISKIMQDETLNADTKNMAVANVNKQLQQNLAKQAWKDFQESDTYINMFKDIERASTASIERMLAKLNELRGSLKNLPADQVRAIVRQMEQLNNETIERNPFKGIVADLKDVIKYSKQRKQIEADIAKTEEMASWSKDRMEAQEKLVFNLQMQYDAAKDNKNMSAAEVAIIKQKLDAARQLLDIYRTTYNTQKEQLSELNKEQDDAEGKADNLRKKIAGITKETRDWADRVNSVVEGLDSMGVLSESFIETWEGGMSVLDSAMSTVESAGQAVADYYSGNYVGAIKNGLSAVGSLFKTIGGIFNIGDKKKERQIQRLQDKVEDLQKAYEKLGVAIEEAYSYDDYNMAYNQSMQNLEAQRQAIQEQMALEKAKKKTNKDRLKEYEDALEELAEREKQLREERYEAMGSVSQKGVLSEAENFVSAWLDAYKETGDGLDALNEHWDEFFENLVMKQASSAVVSARLKNYIDRINAAIDSGETGLSLSQIFAQIGQDLKNELGVWNEDLKAFFDAVGIKGGTGSLLLSDLQKGISNITEPQAAAIEAYLNSMRFAVFEQNNILSSMLEAIQSQYGSSTDNPILSEVKAIRSLVASIDERLSRVIVPKNSAMSSYVMKVN